MDQEVRGQGLGVRNDRGKPRPGHGGAGEVDARRRGRRGT